jgi:hypothetical protein
MLIETLQEKKRLLDCESKSRYMADRRPLTR